VCQNRLSFLPRPLTRMKLQKADISKNDQMLMDAKWSANEFGSASEVPTLLELAGERVLNKEARVLYRYIISKYFGSTSIAKIEIILTTIFLYYRF
jgi:hypothetical protein